MQRRSRFFLLNTRRHFSQRVFSSSHSLSLGPARRGKVSRHTRRDLPAILELTRWRLSRDLGSGLRRTSHGASCHAFLQSGWWLGIALSSIGLFECSRTHYHAECSRQHGEPGKVGYGVAVHCWSWLLLGWTPLHIQQLHMASGDRWFMHSTLALHWALNVSTVAY